jgi:hypothetical protein
MYHIIENYNDKPRTYNNHEQIIYSLFFLLMTKIDEMLDSVPWKLIEIIDDLPNYLVPNKDLNLRNYINDFSHWTWRNYNYWETVNPYGLISFLK